MICALWHCGLCCVYWCSRVTYFAALKRKGKGSDVEEADMDAVVHAHNSEHPFAHACHIVPIMLNHLLAPYVHPCNCDYVLLI